MSPYYCPDCKLYWYYITEKTIEYRLFIFTPIKPKKCPVCLGINEKPPTQQFLDFQKVGRKEMKLEEYTKIYGEM